MSATEQKVVLQENLSFLKAVIDKELSVIAEKEEYIEALYHKMDEISESLQKLEN